MENAPYSVLVSTCDAFADCWEPFFTLLERYWPETPNPILVNTEEKEYSRPNTPINSLKVGRLPWSDQVLAALDRVETPIVLLTLEDFFFESRVRADVVDELAQLMSEREEIRHIGMTHFGSEGPFVPDEDPRLWVVSQRAPYRISMQIGLWRVDALKEALRPGENPWMLEIFGTRRAWRRKELYLTLNRDMFNKETGPVFDYFSTGIIKGKWHPEMKRVFAEQGLDIDFERRGFYLPEPPLKRRLRTLKALAGKPDLLIRGFLGL